MTISVHDIEPGKLGLVAHKQKPHEMNFWTIADGPDMGRLKLNDGWIKLTGHIPHGTTIFVAKHEANGNMYRIVWGEMVGWVWKSFLINPRMNADE